MSIEDFIVPTPKAELPPELIEVTTEDLLVGDFVETTDGLEEIVGISHSGQDRVFVRKDGSMFEGEPGEPFWIKKREQN